MGDDFGCAGALGDFDGRGTRELALVAQDGGANGGIYFFDLATWTMQGGMGLPARLGGRHAAPIVRFTDVTGDGADELALLSANRDEPAGVLFSPGRGAAHVRLDFAAAAAISANFDFDDDDELLFTTPTSFTPGGGFALLRILDFSWQEVRSSALARPHGSPVTLPGVVELRERFAPGR